MTGLLARRMMALAPQGSLGTHFLAVLAAVFPPIAALGHHAFARRMCAFLSVGHGHPHAQLYTLFIASVSRSWTLRIERSRMTRLSLSSSMHVLLPGTRVADSIRVQPFRGGLSPASFADPERRGPCFSSASNQRSQRRQHRVLWQAARFDDSNAPRPGCQRVRCFPDSTERRHDHAAVSQLGDHFLGSPPVNRIEPSASSWHRPGPADCCRERRSAVRSVRARS